MPSVEQVELAIGQGLVELAKRSLIHKVRSARKELEKELGRSLPLIRVHDSLGLDDYAYAISIHGVKVHLGTISSEVDPDLAEERIASEVKETVNHFEELLTMNPYRIPQGRPRTRDRRVPTYYRRRRGACWV